MQWTWEPVGGFTSNVGATYIQTQIDGTFANFSQFGGPPQSFSGNEFPYSPNWQVNADVGYRHALTGTIVGFVGAAFTYRSETKGGLENDPRLRSTATRWSICGGRGERDWQLASDGVGPKRHRRILLEQRAEGTGQRHSICRPTGDVRHDVQLPFLTSPMQTHDDRGAAGPTPTPFTMLRGGCTAPLNHPALLHATPSDCEPIVITYRQLVEQTARAIGALRRLGIAEDDGIAILLPAMPEAVVTLFAASSVGVAFPLNLLLTAPAMRAQLELARTRAVFVLGPNSSLDVRDRLHQAAEGLYQTRDNR